MTVMNKISMVDEVLDMIDSEEARAEHLKRIRELCKLTQQQFSEKLGVSRVHVYRSENGDATFSRSYFLAACAVAIHSLLR